MLSKIYNNIFNRDCPTSFLPAKKAPSNYILYIMMALTFSLFQLHVQAQSTLQFNRVFNLTSSNGTDTVPQNKVWKATSILYDVSLPNTVSSGTGSGSYSNANHGIVIDGQSIATRAFRSGGGYYHASSIIWTIALPIWLESGKTLATGSGVFAISIIEFNISP